MGETTRQKAYHLTTFGCQMNEHDSEHIRGVLEADGWVARNNPEDADLLVFNTCSVRKSAESRLLGRLGEASRLKRERSGRLIAVGGCFAQLKKEKIFSQLAFLDIAFGPQDIAELPRLILQAKSSAKAGSFSEAPAHSACLPLSRSGNHHAWVQVMTGCTNFCSYCVVPYVRGKESSRPAGDIIDEARRLVDEGVSEITLLGQNVNAYGLDAGTAGSGEDFPGLLHLLNEVEGLERIRFTTSHPKDLSGGLIAAIRDLPKVCEHLHLPAQSGSTRVLDRMKRSYSREKYLGLAGTLYQEVPGLALTTDLIVGFPGEKEDDFYRTMTLVQKCRFDGAFTFRYSPRPGTEAAALPGRIPENTIIRRMKELVDLTQQIAREKNLKLVGATLEVKVEGSSRQGGSQLRGRARNNKIVNFSYSDPPAAPGTLVKVRIESATSTTLKGTALV